MRQHQIHHQTTQVEESFLSVFLKVYVDPVGESHF